MPTALQPQARKLEYAGAPSFVLLHLHVPTCDIFAYVLVTQRCVSDGTVGAMLECMPLWLTESMRLYIALCCYIHKLALILLQVSCTVYISLFSCSCSLFRLFHILLM